MAGKQVTHLNNCFNNFLSKHRPSEDSKYQFLTGGVGVYFYYALKLMAMTRKDFNEMIATQSDFLKPYAQLLTKDVDDARDLYQETVFRALSNRKKFKRGTNLKGWLYTIMRNIFINGYRKKQAFRKITGSVPEEVLAYHAHTYEEDTGWNNVRMQEVMQAVDMLPDIYRECFQLYCRGYKYREIAGILEEPPGTVKSRIHFARKILIAKLDR